LGIYGEQYNKSMIHETEYDKSQNIVTVNKA